MGLIQPVMRTAAFRRSLVAVSAAIASPRNEYYLLRHGESLANVEGVISSSPAVAVDNHGLSVNGKQQAKEAARRFMEFATGRRVAIVSSDFKRARETAEAVSLRFHAQPDPHIWQNGVVLDKRLRERFFGEWDGTSTSNYENVWKEDARDANHTIKSVESVNSVLERTMALVDDLDARLDPAHRWIVLLVAHGDVLQILQTAALGLDATKHREIDHLETATLRKMHPVSDDGGVG
mmetsp:Transcript_24604/g.72371  ORF Transcript_24604/g.72371 Transcript_24604/m.72371 type:complete len:236 (-) Transcript_24604:88-795(-)